MRQPWQVSVPGVVWCGGMGSALQGMRHTDKSVWVCRNRHAVACLHSCLKGCDCPLLEHCCWSLGINGWLLSPGQHAGGSCYWAPMLDVLGAAALHLPWCMLVWSRVWAAVVRLECWGCCVAWPCRCEWHMLCLAVLCHSAGACCLQGSRTAGVGVLPGKPTKCMHPWVSPVGVW